VPNGLFLSISIAYALGAVRIARFGALVQQSNSIESLSNVDTLCLDKTGTLTTNNLKLESLYPLGINQADFQQALGDFAASLTASNPTLKAIHASVPGTRRRFLAEIPFSSERKFSALALDGIESGNKTTSASWYALGAPETLRPYLSSTQDWETIVSVAEPLSYRGLRVLLLLARHTSLEDLTSQDSVFDPPSGKGERLPGNQLPKEMLALGLVCLSDELRPEARLTLESFRRVGVRLKIISGDNPDTVAALARQAGFDSDGPLRLVSGIELEKMDEANFAAAASTGTIFGRITPHQKEHLIRAMRQQGRYVAMIGDGVNDVLSLKQADLGIAMQSGSQAARSVADIVLLKDSFDVLPRALEEGQRILNGMQDILKLYLTRILSVVLVIVSAMVVGEFPIGLRQATLLTLLTVGIPTVLMAYWAQPGIVENATQLRRLFYFVVPPVVLSSVVGFLVFHGTFLITFLETGMDLRLIFNMLQPVIVETLPIAQTSLTGFLVCCGLLLVVFAEPPLEWWVGGDVLSSDRRPAILAVCLFLLFILINLIPQLRSLFGLAAIDLREICLISAAVLAWLIMIRIVWRKNLFERFLGL
jgi:cation-transporting ATPase E